MRRIVERKFFGKRFVSLAAPPSRNSIQKRPARKDRGVALNSGTSLSRHNTDAFRGARKRGGGAASAVDAVGAVIDLRLKLGVFARAIDAAGLAGADVVVADAVVVTLANRVAVEAVVDGVAADDHGEEGSDQDSGEGFHRTDLRKREATQETAENWRSRATKRDRSRSSPLPVGADRPRANTTG